MKGVHAGVAEVRNWSGWLFLESDDRAARVQFHDAPSRWLLRVEDAEGRDRAVFPMGIDQRPNAEVREVVGIAGQEELLFLDPLPVRDERAGATEQLGLKECADSWPCRASGKVTAYHLRQMMGIDQHLVFASAVERVEPHVQQGTAVEDQHALRGGVGDRTQ